MEYYKRINNITRLLAFSSVFRQPCTTATRSIVTRASTNAHDMLRQEDVMLSGTCISVTEIRHLSEMFFGLCTVLAVSSSNSSFSPVIHAYALEESIMVEDPPVAEEPVISGSEHIR
jgi:hypothetical protein